MNERFAADAPFRARRATRAAAPDPRSPGTAVERSSGDHPAVAGPPTGPVSVLFESGLAAGGAPPAGRFGPAGRSLAVLIIALGLLGAIWPLTMDLYLPSFVQLEGDFGTTASTVQLARISGHWKACTSGFGSARPLVSIKMWSMRSRRSTRVASTGTNSSCTVQHRQPLASS